MPYKDPEKRKLYQRKYQKAHYSKKSKYYKDKAKANKIEVINWFKDLKCTLKCSKCDENHPSCLEFHHLDSSTKEFNVANMPNRGKSKKSILKEISKCVVLCANCHRKMHYK